MILKSFKCEYERVITVNVKDEAFLETLPEDAQLNTSELASKYGYRVENHQIITQDGYLITVFHLPSRKTGKPLLLMHGLFDSSDTWFLRGNKSIGFALIDEGFDVWVGNFRGNRYGRKHEVLDPDRHARFWNYSFHEIGYYDAAATVDYILGVTGVNQLKVIGHSLGTTVFYTLLSTRPEYNSKISLLVSLAPVAFSHNAGSPMVPVISAVIFLTNQLLNVIGQHELLADHSVGKFIIQFLCMNSITFCAEGILLPVITNVISNNEDQIEYDFYKTVIGRLFAGTSRKTMTHLIQTREEKRFGQFNYDFAGNLAAYGTRVPPDYDLRKISTKVALICGKNDGLSSLKDVNTLRRKLPNVVEYHVFKNEYWNHADFLWGIYVRKLVVKKMLDLFDKY